MREGYGDRAYSLRSLDKAAIKVVMAATMLMYMATPPSLGTATVCIFLPSPGVSGLSTRSRRTANALISGVNHQLIDKAMKKPGI